MKIRITKNKKPKKKPVEVKGFGKVFTDHQFAMDYENGQWGHARIESYRDFSLPPSTSVFHYGQSVFEGLKAYKNEEGEIRLFRPKENFKRMNESCARLCIPAFDEEFVLSALKELVNIDADWIPTAKGTALYIRPSCMGIDAELGVHAARKYVFFIILSPVGAYYSGGLSPVKLLVEEHYTRAGIGGTGANKVVGNYAASLIASEKAIKQGCDQVLWLDAANRKYVEEVGSMNIFFVLNGKVVTPALSGSILPGITRKTVMEYLTASGFEVEERTISIDEIVEGSKSGALTESFGTGTAAVISPVGSFVYKDKEYKVGDGTMGEVATQLYNDLTAIQTGEKEDPFGWVVKIS